MKFLYLIPFFIFPSGLSAQNSTPVQEDYNEIFGIAKKKHGDREYLSTRIKDLPKEHQLSPLVNNNKMYLQYWLTNFVDHEGFNQLKSVEGEEELQKEFLDFLKNDTLFDPLMIKFAERATNPSFVADTVSVDEVLNVAVKYFNILGITEEGYYKGKVCAGLNGITKTLPERKPDLEAFCFSAILKNLQGEEYNLYNEFVAAIKELYKQDLGVDRDARLLRAQGAMFSIMRNNEELRQMLISEYEKRKDYLPFVIEHSFETKKI